MCLPRVGEVIPQDGDRFLREIGIAFRVLALSFQLLPEWVECLKEIFDPVLLQARQYPPLDNNNPDKVGILHFLEYALDG